MKLAAPGDEKSLLTYADFINYSLYDTKVGYYMRDRMKIGRRGDFYTSVSICSVFAEVIAEFFIKQVNENGLPTIFCEIGSGTGQFAYDFIETVRKRNISIFNNLTYYSVEKSPYHLHLQKKKLDPSIMQYYHHISNLPSFSGVIFSNEWLDALPVHVVTKINRQLYEVMIENTGSRLEEKLIPLSNREILSYLKRFPQLIINEGQRVEVPLEMLKNFVTISDILRKGIIMTVDYGYRFDELNSPHLINGTLRGYLNHQMISNILKYPTEMDITHHIHFDALIEEGVNKNMEVLEFLRQDEFLLRNGILNKLVDHQEIDPQSSLHKYNRAIRSLIEPGGISSHFHILIQRIC